MKEPTLNPTHEMRVCHRPRCGMAVQGNRRSARMTGISWHKEQWWYTMVVPVEGLEPPRLVGNAF